MISWCIDSQINILEFDPLCSDRSIRKNILEGEGLFQAKKTRGPLCHQPDTSNNYSQFTKRTNTIFDDIRD